MEKEKLILRREKSNWRKTLQQLFQDSRKEGYEMKSSAHFIFIHQRFDVISQHFFLFVILAGFQQHLEIDEDFSSVGLFNDAIQTMRQFTCKRTSICICWRNCLWVTGPNEINLFPAAFFRAAKSTSAVKSVEPMFTKGSHCWWLR